jgi:crotonobetainyl-CoA:carnitine CoA-transferase CaiB-like acyl-CoA transferase
MFSNYHVFLTCLLAVALSACSGSDKSPTPATAGQAVPITTAINPTSTVSAPSVTAQIAALEASGKLPKLDRSSDIKGPDANNNGIRDDIDAWIAAQPITEVQKKAAQQMARVQQAKTLVDLSDKPALQALGDRTAAAIVCLRLSFMPNYQTGYDLGSQLESAMANTKERSMQYIKYNRARSGSTTSLPDGNTCEP